MSKNYAIIIQFVLPLTMFYWSGAQKSNVYKRDVFVTSWRFHNHAWQPQLPEISRTLWIHRGALTNQRCSLATGCGIIRSRTRQNFELVHIIGPVQNFGPPARNFGLLRAEFAWWEWRKTLGGHVANWVGLSGFSPRENKIFPYFLYWLY